MMWDPHERQEAEEHYITSAYVLIVLGCLKICVALLTSYFEIESVVLDPISLGLIGAIMISLGLWMYSEDSRT